MYFTLKNFYYGSMMYFRKRLISVLISKALQEDKHGIFSYFLIKGMEGEADAHKEYKITSLELHTYIYN